MHIFRFWVDFALKRVRDLIRFLSVKLTTGSRILEINVKRGLKCQKIQEENEYLSCIFSDFGLILR